MIDQRDDAALIQACRAGDAEAWEALLRRYQRLIYAIPRRAGLSDDQAAEVFQRVCTILVEQLDRIAQPERLAGWLATTARRESWRMSRRERSLVPLAEEDPESEQATQLVDQELLPDEQLERLERQQLVRIAVDALDERCRQLITLLFYRVEVPAYADIAAQIGGSEGSIGPTRARCLEKLRRSLDSSII